MCGVTADGVFLSCIVVPRKLMILNEDFGIDVYIKSLFQMQIKLKVDRCFLNLKKKGLGLVFLWAKLTHLQPVLKETLQTSEVQIYWNKTIEPPESLCSCSKVTTRGIISYKAFSSVLPSSSNWRYVFFY